jgi:hypothetical protein
VDQVQVVGMFIGIRIGAVAFLGMEQPDQQNVCV